MGLLRWRSDAFRDVRGRRWVNVGPDSKVSPKLLASASAISLDESGWTDVKALSGNSQLRHLSIQEFQTMDLDGLRGLELETLRLYVPRAASSLGPGDLPRLREVEFRWSRELSGLLSCDRLEMAIIEGVRPAVSAFLSGPHSLRSLRLNSGSLGKTSVNVAGIESLYLAGVSMEGASVSNADSLREVDLDAVRRLDAFPEVGAHLERLSVEETVLGDADSYERLLRCPRLSDVLLVGKHNVPVGVLSSLRSRGVRLRGNV